jgi:hypothetical protein
MTFPSRSKRLLLAATVAVVLIGCAREERSIPTTVSWPGDVVITRAAPATIPKRSPARAAAAAAARTRSPDRTHAGAVSMPVTRTAAKAPATSDWQEATITPPASAKAKPEPGAGQQLASPALPASDANSGSPSSPSTPQAIAQPPLAAPPQTAPAASRTVVIKNAAASNPPAPAAERSPSPGPQLEAAPKPAQPADDVLDAIVQAELQFRVGNIDGARKGLETHVREKYPEAIAELGRTYDPIELAAVLAPATASDAARAAQLYGEAARLGSARAQVRLTRLQQWLAQKAK